MRFLNLGVLAHVDAGKTTATEQLLYKTGQIRRAGSVKGGDTQTDFLPIERQRGISVRAAEASFSLGDTLVNLIDTPGHADFVSEVERALSVLTAALLVLSAPEGVQPQAEMLLRTLQAMRLPTLILVNKIDRVGCAPEVVLAELSRLGVRAFPLNAPVSPGERGCCVRDAPMAEEDAYRLAEEDERLAELLLSGRAAAHDLSRSLAAQTAAGAACPLVYGAAQLGVGMDALLQAIETYLPREAGDAAGPAGGVVFRITHDDALGKLAHIKLVSGTLRRRDALCFAREGAQPEKAAQLKRPAGARYQDLEELWAGDIAAVSGLASARVGDVFGSATAGARGGIAQEPLLRVRACCPPGQLPALLDACAELCDEDPSLAVQWAPRERELTLRVRGTMHIELLGALFSHRFGLDASLGAPSVIYKATPKGPGAGFEAYTMPKPCWAVVHLLVEPLPRGTGMQFLSLAEDRRIAYRYQHHVEQSVRETLAQGRLGWEVTDLLVTLADGEHHPIHTHPLDFFLATPIALMRALDSSGEDLLEPYLLLQMTLPEQLAGRLVGEIIAMRGEMLCSDILAGRTRAEALVPVATSMDFPARFASFTSGRGMLSARFHGYRLCPLELGAATPLLGIDPLDRAKWILHKRGAIQ